MKNPNIILSAFIFCMIMSNITAMDNSEVKSQLVLNGFSIGQHFSVVDNSFQNIKDDNFDNGMTQKIVENINGEIVFYFAPHNPMFIYGIRVSGNENFLEENFIGINLQDDKAELTELYGDPKEIIKDIFIYEDTNISFRIIEDKIVGISIIGFDGFKDKPDKYNGLDLVKEALLNNDIEMLQEHIMPDIEIHTKDGIVRIEKSFISTFDSDSIFKDLIFENDNSLKVLLLQKNSFRGKLRLFDNKYMGFVYDFDEGDISEIVFRFMGGNWKIWEIFYRDKFR